MVDIDEYWVKNKVNFPDFDGWNPLIKEMLQSLFENGFDPNNFIGAKDKYGHFVFLSGTNFDIEILKQIAEDYTNRIDKACEICGEPAETSSVHGWDSTFCLKHYLASYPTLLNIDDIGFECNGERFNWKDIQSYELKTGRFELTSPDENLNDIWLIFHPSVTSSKFFIEHYLSIDNEYLNWFLFLRNLSAKLPNEFLTRYIDRFDNSLTPCPICGYIAVSEHRCHYCTNNLLNIESLIKQYQEKGWDYIKDQQIWFHRFIFRKTLKSMEISFAKDEDYVVRFTEDELSDPNSG